MHTEKNQDYCLAVNGFIYNIVFNLYCVVETKKKKKKWGGM